MNEMAKAMMTYRDVSEPRLMDADSGLQIDSVAIPLGGVSADLDGTHAVLTVSDGVVVVDSLVPHGAAAFKATPNAMIEDVVRQALRAMVALGSGRQPLVDGDNRRVTVDKVLLYPDVMHDIEIPRDGWREARDSLRRNGIIVKAVAAAIIAAIILVYLGFADPTVLILIPGLILWCWSLMLASRTQTLIMEGAPSYKEHVRRARMQSRSIAMAASRARGLTKLSDNRR